MNRKIFKRRIKFILNPIYNYILKSNHRRNFQYTRFYDKQGIIENTILYESRDGKSLTDSPFAIFQYLLDSPEYSHFQHIWSVHDFKDLEQVIRKYKNCKNVKFVKRNSREYLKYLASSKYLINNSTFQSFFTPRDEQVYINTWHGTPLKRMGFDLPGNPSQSQNVVRNFLCADYLLSPNEHTTKMFLDSYKLKGIYNGEIIQEGYPRIDLTFHSDTTVIKSFLNGLGINIDFQKPSILYAPTWKGTQVTKAKNDMYQIIADMTYLIEQVGQDYNLFIKVHPYLYSQAKKFPGVKDRLIPDYVDTNELLSIVDILITDYSSIFFDYLVTDKPILFYVWDYDDYFDERGLYLSEQELPGPMLFTIGEVTEAVQNISNVKEKYNRVYDQAKKRFANHDDGQVTQRIVDYIFSNKPFELKIHKPEKNNKKKLLIYPGGMMNNGITASFINLMDNIDYEQYDVSVFIKPTNSKEALNNLAKVNKNARFLFRHGLPVYRLHEAYFDKLVHNRGAKSSLTKNLYPETAYKREYQRYFGRVRFDYCIDFSGYSFFWAKYMLAAESEKKICYMHSDLLSDSNKVINGRRPHLINLRGLFSVYNRFDKLVSVSPGSMELNKTNLSEFAEEFKFDYVLNSINYEKILKLANEENRTKYEENLNQANETNELICNNSFLARAILTNPNNHKIWNRPYMIDGAKEIISAQEFLNSEVLILREARTINNRFYKFCIKDRITGWLEASCFQLMPDSILAQSQVNKVAIIQKTYGHDIWSKPYKIEGTRKISPSKDFKGFLVLVDSEARTQHGVYNRIIMNGTVLGWIDSDALSIIKEFDGKGNLRSKLAKSKYTLAYYPKYRKVLANRTLEEKNMYEAAVITNTENYQVWSKPYPNLGAKRICSASEIKDEKVIITKSNRTMEGNYYFFYLNGKQVGWLSQDAFTIIKEPVIISQHLVNRVAKIKLAAEDIIYRNLSDANDSEVLIDSQKYNGKTVEIEREAKTIEETYCYFSYQKEAVGWLNKRSFQVIETMGIQQGKIFIPTPSKENYNFVTMGRLSPEKGHDNLIKAFSRFHDGFKNSKLYIIGQGPLRQELEKLIAELDLTDSVYLTGQLENPFSLMKKCDCFVLSSHYEGQPMVLLEAMIHGMNIVATDIIANRTVLENGRYGLLVEDSIEGLEKGLQTLATNQLQIPLERFDPKEYNRRAMETFYKVLE